MLNTVRAYLECFEDPMWAFDSGPGTPQTRVMGIIIESGMGYTQTNLFADNKQEPKAWIQFDTATVQVVNKIAIIRG